MQIRQIYFFLDKICKLLTYHTLTNAKLSTFTNGLVFWLTLYSLFVVICVQYIQCSCSPVIRALEPSLTVKAKDELATVLVSVLQSIDAARDFLVEVVVDEVKNEGFLTVSYVINSVIF